MAYVRTRTTKSGSVSTALVEAYRDENGRPRQRLIANLHGEPSALTALAKLATRREGLRTEQKSLKAEEMDVNTFYEIVTQRTQHGHQHSAAERKEIDRLTQQRRRLLRRMAKIEADLAAIHKDGAAIKRHCAATPDEIQTAIQALRQRHRNAETVALGMQWALQQHRKELPRLSNWFLREDATWQVVGSGFVVYRASGGTDTAGLNAAIASLPGGVGTVWLPDPLYQFATGPVNIPQGVRLVGMGAGTVQGSVSGNQVQGTELRATAAITTLFLFTDAPGSGMENVQITGSITNAIGFAASGFPKNFTQCMFRRVSIQTTTAHGTISNGFNFGTNTAATPVQFHIYDCIINNCGAAGIVGSNTSGGGGLEIVNTTFGGGVNAINTTGIGLTLINCYIQSPSGAGIVAVGKTVPGVDMGFPFLALGTLVDGSGGDGWQLTNWPNLEISGLLNASACHGNGFTLTNITNFKLSAHVEVCFAHGIALSGCSKGSINGCVVVNNAGGVSGTNGTGDAINMSDCHDIVVSGNKATNNAPGTSILGNQGYGLRVDAATTNIKISGNDFDGNAGLNKGQIFVTTGALAIRIIHAGIPFDPTDLAAVLPAASCPGSILSVQNSNTATWGATVGAGAPSATVKVCSNGTNWTVLGI